MLLQIWNMHGPTVYYENDWAKLNDLLDHLNRLNDPRSNAGLYRLFLTIGERTFELREYNAATS